MSFQIGVLKVLSSYPDGCATVDAIKRDLIMLASREWNAQLRCLAARAPRIDVFSTGLIRRNPGIWQITETGRAFLARLESGEPFEDVTHTDPGPSLPLLSRPQRPRMQYRPAIEIRRPEPRRRSRRTPNSTVV